MQDKVAAHQEAERWKAAATAVVVGCQIIRARAIDCSIRDRRNPALELLVENFSGTWRLPKSLHDFRTFTSELERAFPVEAGERRHNRILPGCPTLGGLMFLASPRKKATILRKAVDEFCKALLALPPYISRARIVLDFFLPDGEPTAAPSMMEGTSVRSYSITSVSSSSQLGSLRQHSTTLYRVKVRYGSECKLVDYDPASRISVFLRSVLTKHGIPSPAVHATYRDRDGDVISITDNEDLDIAISLFGKGLMVAVVE